MDISISNNGIRIANAPLAVLRARPGANQSQPRGSYVYAHVDQGGRIFYIGKGIGRRAWSDDRHELWLRDVNNRSGGKYEIKILADGLGPDEAEALEGQWLAQEAATLVNWSNMARRSDYAAIDRFHKLRNANRALAQETRELEKSDLAQAVENYAAAIEVIAGYAFMKLELDLVGELIDDENAEIGFTGDLAILDRYTMVLVKLGRAHEAKTALVEYGAKYKRDQNRSALEKIKTRVEKALRKVEGRGRNQ
jgi:hypothetical protein